MGNVHKYGIIQHLSQTSHLGNNDPGY